MSLWITNPLKRSLWIIKTEKVGKPLKSCRKIHDINFSQVAALYWNERSASRSREAKGFT